MNIVQMGMLFAIFAPFALAIWVGSRRLPPVTADGDTTPDGTEEFPLNRMGFAAVTLDVVAAVKAAAEAAHSVARANFVLVELAVRPGTIVRTDPNVLQVALRAAIRTAIQATPGGQVLVTATPLGCQLLIRIVDDGVNTDQRSREVLLREAETLVALQGGSIAVETRRGHGTSVSVRLPLPYDASVEMAQPEEPHALTEQAA